MGHDQLVLKDYSAQAREQIVFFGETSAISDFDAGDLLDINNLGLIFNGVETQKFFSDSKGATTEENIEFAKSTNESLHVYAVRGSGDGPVDHDEIGEVQGYISTFIEEPDSVLKVLVEANILPSDYQNKKVFGIDYAARPDSSRHQMASGVRTVCQITRKFESIEQMKTSGEETIGAGDVPIIAFVEVGNEKSGILLERCGFEKLPGELNHEITDNRQSTVWLLNWAKLDSIMQQRADKKLLSAR